VLVPNSDRAPVDRYEIEARTVGQFCRPAGRPAVAVA
jgi:mannosyl-3-phosphoglycerate synthase